MHGYDLRKRMREDFGLLSSLSFGSLYPALARLEASGAVREVASEHRNGGVPPAAKFTSAGSIAGERAAFRARLASRRAASTRSGAGTRGRRVYEITAAGRRTVPPPARNRGTQVGRRAWLRAALGLRWVLEPRGQAGSPTAQARPIAGHSGRVAAGGRIALADARPLPAFPRRPRQGSHRARSELDRPSHRHRTGGPGLLTGAPRGVRIHPSR